MKSKVVASLDIGPSIVYNFMCIYEENQVESENYTDFE